MNLEQLIEQYGAMITQTVVMLVPYLMGFTTQWLSQLKVQSLFKDLKLKTNLDVSVYQKLDTSVDFLHNGLNVLQNTMKNLIERIEQLEVIPQLFDNLQEISETMIKVISTLENIQNMANNTFNDIMDLKTFEPFKEAVTLSINNLANDIKKLNERLGIK